MSKSNTSIGFGGIALVCASLFVASPALAREDPAIASEIMGLARSQWAAEIAGKSAAEQLASVAEDYTEFNVDYPTLLVGKAMALQMLSLPQGVTSLFGEMQNARVQVYGDTAILTYNFAGVNKLSDGKIRPSTAKSTRVYAKQGGKWMLVHANFAPISAGD
jgi:ketosteroid isomerase-like protein